MRHVIIGNSAAGVSAALAIRRLRPEDEIIIISPEPQPYYSRVLLSHFIARTVKYRDLILAEDGFYRLHGFTRMFGSPVVAIESGETRVVLESGTTVEYDRLLIAAGSSSKKPSFPVEGLTGVFTLRSLDDALEIKDWVQPGQKAVIMGAGMVGLKTAEALVHRGLEVTVVASSDRVFSQVLDPGPAALVRKGLEARGVTVITGQDVLTATGRGAVEGVLLNSGTELPCNVLIAGKGVDPNSGPAAEAGIATGRGIIVDDRMATNIEGVYAAGDVAEAYDLAWRKRRVNALWPLAVEQGAVAGANMAGGSVEYSGGMAMNSFHWDDIAVITLGISVPRGEAYRSLETPNTRRGVYRQLVLEGDRLVGAALVGDTRGAGILRALIANGGDVSGLAEGFISGRLEYGRVGLASFIAAPSAQFVVRRSVEVQDPKQLSIEILESGGGPHVRP